MLFTQTMTPQAGMDPSQQKMMNLMMPLMLGVISWNLAAGLCLYWAEGTVDRHRAAVHHEPHATRPRNARDGGKARPEERQISYQLSAISFQ